MRNIIVFSFVLLMISCNPESKPITYGQDKCDFCRMSIVDQRFAGEIVTQKGKVFKFDAVECMLNYINNQVEDQRTIKLIQTNTYDNPGKLHDVHECMFLVSKNMPSPMGMFINPFEDVSIAMDNQREHKGTIYKWEELGNELSMNY